MSQHEPTEDPFVREVRRQAERARTGRRRMFYHELALAGSVGWMVSLPAVLGSLVGRWLDTRFGSGVFWTLVLLLVGTALGCASAWRHVQRGLRE